MNGQQNNEYGNNNARSAKRRNGKRMNLVDWILVLVVLASVGVFVYFAFFSELDIFGSKEEKVSVQYTVRVEKVNAEMLGVEIDGEYTTKPAKARILKIDKEKNISRIEITIHEGKNRQVRKMCEAIGKKVLALHRAKIGNLGVKDLKLGTWRYLKKSEVEDILK